MGKWDYAAVHGMNKYLWSKLQSELGWSADNYGGLIPITTPEQQPEFNAYDFPYIVYSYSPQGTNPLYVYEAEIQVYTVFSTSNTPIRQAVNLIRALFGQFDDSAKDVNKYISTFGTTDNKSFDYKSIQVTAASGPEPALTEGGRRDGNVIVRTEYTFYQWDSTTHKEITRF